MKAKILADFQICISVPLKKNFIANVCAALLCVITFDVAKYAIQNIFLLDENNIVMKRKTHKFYDMTNLFL